MNPGLCIDEISADARSWAEAAASHLDSVLGPVFGGGLTVELKLPVAEAAQKAVADNMDLTGDAVCRWCRSYQEARSAGGQEPRARLPGTAGCRFGLCTHGRTTGYCGNARPPRSKGRNRGEQ
jgi:hypothetical protein